MESDDTQAGSDQKKFGRYVVQKLLGEGAMGKVFLAHDPVLKRQVAIKVISVDRHLDEKTRSEFLSRFSLEARLSAQLNHPSIVPVYDAGEERGVPWIAFQYIDGVTLDKIIKSKGRLSVKWAVHIALDIASALQLAHSQHIVHRDIKPGNIIVDRQGGVARLADFGVAKVPWASLTMEGNAMGSPGYMSPEQIEGFSVDERSDIFSLGVVLYEMLTGKHPFVRETVAATAFATLSGKFPRASEIVTDIPRELDDMIARCLAPKPDQRVKSATQMIELLRSVVPSGGAVSGSWPVAAEKRPLGSISWSSFVAWIRAIMAKLMASRPKDPPTLVSAKIHPAPRRTSSLITRSRNLARTMAFVVRKAFRGVWRGALRFSGERRFWWVAGSLIALVFAATIIVFMLAKGGTREWYFPESGLDPEQKILVAKARSWAASGMFDSAAVYASALSVTAEGAARGHFLLGIIACQRGDHDAAIASFEAAAQYALGPRLLQRNGEKIVDLCMPVLTRKRASDAMVGFLAKKCGAADLPVLKKAVYERPYWLRWNALRILQAAGKQVDLVRVFILDLKYSRTLKTRLQAIRDLADLGDRRAIPALREAARKGIRDPFVSSAAAKTLKEVFKEEE